MRLIFSRRARRSAPFREDHLQKYVLARVLTVNEPASVVAGYQVSTETVLDAGTRLTWQRRVPAGTMDWDGAKQYCRSLPLAGGGWRLPTRNELESLVDESARPTIKLVAFPQTPPEMFWSSSASDWNPRDPWVVYFNFGISQVQVHSARSAGQARCVR